MVFVVVAPTVDQVPTTRDLRDLRLGARTRLRRTSQVIAALAGLGTTVVSVGLAAGHASSGPAVTSPTGPATRASSDDGQRSPRLRAQRRRERLARLGAAATPTPTSSARPTAPTSAPTPRPVAPSSAPPSSSSQGS